MAFILASGSPRRRELLSMLGIPFEIQIAQIDETMRPGADPAEEVARICKNKAMAVLPRTAPGDLILAADTIVCIDGKILGKPKTPDEAVRMLRRLSGRTHIVRTGVTVLQGAQCVTEVEQTEVHFRALGDEEIARYVATKDPMDKAGAYGIQGQGALFVQGICGDYYNVMGLPLCRLGLILKQFGISLLGGAAQEVAIS